MIKPKCIRAGSLIAARSSGLSRADGLWLEDHIASCEQCAGEAALMSGVVAVAESFEPELSVATRSRVVREALRAHAAGEHAAASAPSFGLGWGAGLAGAVALAALVAVFALRGDEGEVPRAERPVKDPAAVSAPANMPTSTEVARLLAGERVRASTRTQVTLDHVSVELAPQSEAQWNEETHELSLSQGELLAEVDPKPQRPFAVVTQAFRVEVLGTRFEVTQSSVVVLRGRVRVVSPSGEERAIVNAGERYDHVIEAVLVPGQPEPETREQAGERVNVAALLTQARDALAAGQLERSRRAIESVLAAKPRATARAEALTLRAELYDVQGDRASAIAAYLEVASRFSTLAAGENALFAAARLERSDAKAHKLLSQYLERYPRGRFVVEAKYRLERSAP
jgi:hypothetical protein